MCASIHHTHIPDINRSDFELTDNFKESIELIYWLNVKWLCLTFTQMIYLKCPYFGAKRFFIYFFAVFCTVDVRFLARMRTYAVVNIVTCARDSSAPREQNS